MKIDDYFIEHSDKLYYIELKDSTITGEQIPLPILQDDFAENIESGEFEEEVSVEYFIRGILFNIAVDPDFLYKNEYKDFLEKAFRNPEEELFLFALSYLNESYALHFFRGIYKLGYRSLNTKFFYAWLLLQSINDEEIQFKVLKFFNQMIEEDPEYPLSYFGLGLIEKEQLNFIKAHLYFEKSRELLDYSSELSRELKGNFLVLIEEEIRMINKDVKLQEGAQFLNQGRISEAFETFEGIDDGTSGIIKYFLGKTHLLRSEDELAFQNFEKALDLDFKEISLYLDYSYLLSLHGQQEKALELLNDALDIYKEEENLLYNRAHLYLQLEDREKAIEDFKTIISYEDVNEEIYSSVLEILHDLEVL